MTETRRPSRTASAPAAGFEQRRRKTSVPTGTLTWRAALRRLDEIRTEAVSVVLRHRLYAAFARQVAVPSGLMPNERDAAIAAHLQSELRRRRLDEVDAVTAAAWLSERALLPDSGQRPGLPLRRLLRAGRIEGGEQRPNAPYGRWFIVRIAGQATRGQGDGLSEGHEPAGQIGPEADETTTVSREGDPDEFDEVLEGGIADDDVEDKLQIPPGLVRQLLANPAHASELLAMRAVEQFADRAERDVRLLRERNPDVSDRQLAVYFKKKYSRAASWEGAGTGVVGIVGLPADLALLAWIQNRLLLSIAATYGHDMTDPRERAAELLIIQGVHGGREVARRGLDQAAKKAAAKLITRHLRKDALLLVKQLFKTVGITFTRKALLEKGIPLLSVPISAGVNHLSTRLLANQAIKFYDTDIR